MDKRKQDSAVEVDAQGIKTNTRLHQELTEGVNDHDFRMQDKAALIKAGVPKTVMDRLISG